jgi:holo-[acyl-carrier protein] synthase
MIIIRNGVDILEIDRLRESILRHGERFLDRIFTQNEIYETGKKVESLAVRFAAKEAVSKALGTGIGKISWKDVEILRGDGNQPILRLLGKAEVIAKELGITTWSITLSHTSNLAIAFVIGSGSSIG